MSMNYLHDLNIFRFRKGYVYEWDNLPVPMREAKVFLKLIEAYPVHIEPDDLFAGWYGFKTEEEMTAAYPPEPEGALEKLPHKQEGFPTLPDIGALRAHGFHPGSYDTAHHENDYRAILSGGMNQYKTRISEELRNPENSEEKNVFLEAMLESLKGVEMLSYKFAELAKTMAEQAEDAKDRERLLRIEAACRKVPMEPPEDFFEAVQAAYLVRILTSISYVCCVSVSFGNFDRYMYPYYLASKEKGVSDDEILAILLQLYRILDNYGGNDCAISVGGVDENDRDATNELSFLMIRAEKMSKLRSPLFTARIHAGTPKEFLRELVSRELFEIGQPSFYSEERCREAVASRGIAIEEARNWNISTCMNLVMAGQEAAHGWGCKVNTHLPLELALNGGQPLSGTFDLPLKTPPKRSYADIDEVYDQYRSYLRELLHYAMEWQHLETKRMAQAYPNPFIAVLTEDCISRGKDRWDGGARYHNLVMEMMGFANTADAFTAIDALVFEQKKYTPDDFIAAAQADYVGYEDFRDQLLRCAKYGMNNEKADGSARRVLAIASELCEEMRAENRRYLPSLHTLWDDVHWGRGIPAFFDGRRSGEPVNKNAGPATLARRAGPTALVLSAGRLDQIRCSGGQALDVHIGARNLDTDAGRDKIGAFIKTYFALGGLQIQVNALSSETLQKAYDHPEEYPDLLVRIGGHSRYFNEFDNDMKQKFIERFKIEEGADA
ncbi:MAG: hypothetical protein IKU40_05115 [Clostridia bacterium]|nr:hypothetical protein [Clostridia bacterium]